MKWTLISDDLSGACETGSAINQELNMSGAPLKSFLSVNLYSVGKVPEFQVISLIDLNIRDHRADDAQSVLVDFLPILKQKSPESINFFKVDSLLRGNLTMQANILAKENPIILIPAVPALNRIVRNGAVYIEDLTLIESNLWKDQERTPPKKIGELFPDLRVIDSDFESKEVIAALLSNLSPGEIFIPDIHSAHELAIISEILTKFPHVIAMGSAQFALAHFMAFRGSQVFDGQDVVPQEILGAMVLVGSNSSASLAQLAYLNSSHHIPLSSDDIIVKLALADDLTKLLSDDFAARALFISGGTTARRFLDAAGMTQLRMLNSLEYGVALSVSADNELIGIKPGSFGKEDTISKSLTAMLAMSTLSNRN